MKEYMESVRSCGDLLQRCEREGTLPAGNKTCSNAWTTCVSSNLKTQWQESTILQAVVGTRLMTDLTKSQTDPPYPSDSYLNYLRNGGMMAKIGATVTFEQCNGGIARGFELSGDLACRILPN